MRFACPRPLLHSGLIGLESLRTVRVRELCNEFRYVPTLASVIAIILPFAAYEAITDSSRADEFKAANTIRMQAGPYCGVYSLMAVAGALDQPIALSDLATRRYVGSELGSSGAELVDAARTHGLCASFVTGLAEWDLRMSNCPLILRISSAERRDVFNHWVAYLGEESGRARILDYPDSLMLYPFPELLSRWDGSAVLVSRDDANGTHMIWLSRLRAGLVLLATAGIIFLFCRRIGRRTMPRELSSILGAAIMLALASDLLRSGSLLRDTRLAKVIAVASGTETLPTLSAEDVRLALDADEESLPIIVDARLPRDYQRGHIPGAINIPAWASLSSRRDSIAAIPKSSEVIVYCQSSACSYDEDVAALFVGEGFANVRVFHGGWQEWNETRR